MSKLIKLEVTSGNVINLLYPFEETEHLSIDGKQVLHEDLVHFNSIVTENVNEVIEARLSGDIITLKPVYVTEKDYEEANRIEHLTKWNNGHTANFRGCSSTRKVSKVS